MTKSQKTPQNYPHHQTPGV